MKTKYLGDKTVSLHIRISADMKKELEKMSKEFGLDVSTIFRLILKNAIDNGGVNFIVGNKSNSVQNAHNSTITQSIS